MIFGPTARRGILQALLAIGVAGLAMPAFAQGPLRPRANPKQRVLPANPQPANQPTNQVAQNRAKADQAKGKAAQQAQARAEQLLERLLAMTPNQRVRALANQAPARRQRLLGMLAEIDAMPDEDRALLRGRYQQFLALGVARRTAIRAELRILRGLTRVEIRRRLASEESAQSFTPAERRLMFQITGQDAAQGPQP